MLKKRIWICAVLLAASVVAWGKSFGNESLDYHIVYHWGLIWKHAASATLEIKEKGANYEAKLCARTLSWVDNIYKVRDTLYATIERERFVPLKYVKATHEKGYDAFDVVEFSYKGNTTTGKCTRVRPGKEDSKKVLTAEGKAYDMLSVFYLLRSLDMQKLKAEKTYKTTVFSGIHKEALVIKYVGVERIELRDDSRHFAHHVKFTFTQDGKKKSSDDIDAWISANDSAIPLMLRGKLPIGEVRVFYSAGI